METIGICLRCGTQFEGEFCPLCDVDKQEPEVDLRAVAAWEELKEQGLPVSEIPWTRLKDYYEWVQRHNAQRLAARPSHPSASTTDQQLIIHLSSCPACGGDIFHYAWGRGCEQCGWRELDAMAPLANRWAAPGSSVMCGVKAVCTEIGNVRCRYCNTPVCANHAEWTLDGIVCASCLPLVPSEYR
jgi:hypothetical protein